MMCPISILNRLMAYQPIPSQPLLERLKEKTLLNIWNCTKEFSTPYLYLNLEKALLVPRNIDYSCNVKLDYNKTTAERVVLTGTLSKCPIVLDLVPDKTETSLAIGKFYFGSLSPDQIRIEK